MTAYQVLHFSIRLGHRQPETRVNSQIVGQVVLLQRVSLKPMRDFIEILTSYSTYETFGLQKKRCKTFNDLWNRLDTWRSLEYIREIVRPSVLVVCDSNSVCYHNMAPFKFFCKDTQRRPTKGQKAVNNSNLILKGLLTAKAFIRRRGIYLLKIIYVGTKQSNYHICP